MPDDSFFSLTAQDQIDALEVAASRIGRPAYLLEKDVWVVLVLQALFSAPFGEHLTFKGGTSLSKAYGVIRRFSEDLDITYDIRELIPDLTGPSESPLPATRNQAEKWRKRIEDQLSEWVEDEAAKVIETELSRWGASAQVSAVKERLHVAYRPLSELHVYVKPEVMVEFGGRATGEPREQRPVECDAAAHIPEVIFPSASPLTMIPERTFWEKATLIHVFCKQKKGKGARYSRHWHDLVRLDDAGYAKTALADLDLRRSVAQHKAVFFRERDAGGARIDYEAAVAGSLSLMPDGEAYETLASDYAQMVEGGLLHDDAEPFPGLMARCADIEERANANASTF